MSTRNLPIFVSLAALIAGCAGDKHSYSVVVANQSDRPVTVWLTQSTPTSDPQWVSPEDIAIISPGTQNPTNRVVVLPGQTATTGNVSARFKDDTNAVLRVYVGERTYDELLAMSRGNPNRFDLVLAPGTSEVVLSQRDGMVVANITEPGAAPAKQ